jgi:hypothetical protein
MENPFIAISRALGGGRSSLFRSATNIVANEM